MPNVKQLESLKKKKKNPARTIPMLMMINALIFTNLNYIVIDISQFFEGPMLNRKKEN